MTSTITRGHDAGTQSANPNRNYADSTKLLVGNSAAYIYIYFPLPDDIAGRTIASATLIGHASGAFTSVNLGVRAIVSGWSASSLTWNNAPTVSSSVVNTTPASAADGAEIDLDATATIQAAANGADWYGLRVGTTDTSMNKFAAFDSALPSWSLVIEYSDAPETPQALVPNGTVVGSGAPVVSCDFTDNGGLSTDMGAIQVQVSTTTSFSSPAFDSGTVATATPSLDLAAAGFTAISSGSSRYWRVRVQDTSGLWSGWSDPAAFTYRPLPTITLNTPAAGVLWDPTSDVVATSSANLSKFRVQVTDGSDRTNIRYDSGVIAANPSNLTQIAVSLPEKYGGQRILVDDRNYQLHVRAWDTYTTRQATPGKPAFFESWSTFHFDDDLATTPISTLQADQGGAGPSVTLTWTRPSAGDAWIVLRADESGAYKVIARLDPVDVISGTSTWSWTDPHPPQWRNLTYDVRALSGGKRSKAGPIAAITPGALGLWLFTQDGQAVQIEGTGVDTLAVTDRRSTYKPLNLRYDVDIVTGFEGLSGTFTGTISSDDESTYTVAEKVATLLSIKENPAMTVKLVYGYFAGEVLLRNLSVTPNASGNSAIPVMTVSFGVNQTGDFDAVI